MKVRPMLPRAALALGLALAATLLPTATRLPSARACSLTCSHLQVVPVETRVVAEGGTTLLYCEACRLLPAAPVLEAVDGTGATYPGVVSELTDEASGSVFGARTYLVWRPMQAMPPGGYRLRMLGSPTSRLCFPDDEIHVPAATAAEALPATTLTLGTSHRPTGTLFKCTQCGTVDTGTQSHEAPYLQHRIPVAGDHSARAKYLVRLVAEAPSGAITGEWKPLDDVAEPTHTEDGILVAAHEQRGGVSFAAAQDEYCAAIELWDVVNDTHEVIDAGCAQHDLPSERLAPVPSFETCQLNEPEQYAHAFCRDNAPACEGSSEPQCDAWREHCAVEPPDDTSDGGTAPEGVSPPSPAQSKDAGAIGHGHAGGGLDPDAGSAATARSTAWGCRAGAVPGTSATWPLALLASWLVLATRRRAR